MPIQSPLSAAAKRAVPIFCDPCHNRGVAVPSAPEQAEQSRPDLGVLFVHGIGEQLQGETLTHFADPLSSWFTRWLTKNEEVEPGQEVGGVALSDTQLVPGESAPAHTLMTVPDPLGKHSATTWLLAESWWADTFRPPKTKTLLIWVLTILPLMLLEQFSVPLRRSLVLRRQGRSHFPWLRIGAFALLLVASLPLAGLGLVLITLLLLPVLIPIKSLRDPAKNAALKLAYTLGDAFILTSSTVQYDAMVQRVAANIAWLAAQARSVVVVAHSQGAAVSYEAIRRYGSPPNLELFVTLGQGLGKLQRFRALRVRHRTFGYLISWAAVAAFFVFAVFSARAATTAVVANGGHVAGLAVDSSLAALGLAGVVIVFLFFVRTSGGIPLFETPPPLSDATGADLPWTNYYASADPVSNGPLCDKDVGPRWLEDVEVWNRGSIVGDHTSYVNIPDDFMACLSERLLRALDPPTVDADLRTRIHRARWQSWWRVWWLAATRVLSVAAAASGAASIGVSGRLDDIGVRLHWLRSIVHYVADPLRHTFGIGTDLIGDSSLTGGLVVVAGVVGAYALLAAFWSSWAGSEAAAFFLRPESGTPPLGGRGFGLFIAVLVQVGAYAALIAYNGDYPTDWHDIADHWLWPLCGLPLLALLPFLVDPIGRRPAAAIEKRLMRWFPVRDPYSASPT
jgi:hypothetical protein